MFWDNLPLAHGLSTGCGRLSQVHTQIPQCGLGDIHADGGAIVFDSEPEFAGAMLVEYGSHGIQAFAQLGEAFFELDGFGFVHFKSGSAQRKAWGVSFGWWILRSFKFSAGCFDRRGEFWPRRVRGLF